MRGGGWREAGEGLNKQIGVSDFLAAAEWLVDEGRADPAGVIANGNSAGGPVVTSAVLQRPELFAALLVDFAYLDVVGGLAGGAGTSLQYRSFGHPDDPEQLDSMLQWSPYQLAQRPGCDPPTFVSTRAGQSVGLPASGSRPRV
jgi:prolyl oligopeptidase PreP (S9A serine peptidase family)